MGWIEKRRTEPEHVCDKPSDRELDDDKVAEGSVWECIRGHRWRFDGWQHGVASAQNDKWAIWNPVPTRRPEPFAGQYGHTWGNPGKPDGGYAAAVRDDPSTQPGGAAVQQQWER